LSDLVHRLGLGLVHLLEYDQQLAVLNLAILYLVIDRVPEVYAAHLHKDGEAGTDYDENPARAASLTPQEESIPEGGLSIRHMIKDQG
jgi:hypothetical protein